MNKEELKAMVAQMLRDMGQHSGSAAPAHSAAPSHSDGAVDDRSKIDLRKQYLVETQPNGPAFLALKAKTPARIGVGRAGERYNKDEYLTRPDLGRRFDEKNQAIIKETCGHHPKVLLVIGDGLSSAAIEANAMDCARAIRQGLSAYGIELGKTLFIQYCRVGASDHIGSLTDAELVCMLVGERPGLVTAESMSAYLTYNPRIGVPESARTVVSNIHRQGTPAVEAGAHIASLIRQMLEKKCSGVAFRQGVGQ